MASFNTTIYDGSAVSYNIFDPQYIYGNNCIPVSGTKWYPGLFGNVMCSFVVDGGDSILGGNTIITGDISACSNIFIKGNLKVNGNATMPTLTPGDTSTSIANALWV